MYFVPTISRRTASKKIYIINMLVKQQERNKKFRLKEDAVPTIFAKTLEEKESHPRISSIKREKRKEQKELNVHIILFIP